MHLDRLAFARELHVGSHLAAGERRAARLECVIADHERELVSPVRQIQGDSARHAREGERSPPDVGQVDPQATLGCGHGLQVQHADHGDHAAVVRRVVVDPGSAFGRAEWDDARHDEVVPLLLEAEADPRARAGGGQDLRRADGEAHGHRAHEPWDVVVTDRHALSLLVDGDHVAHARVLDGAAAADREPEEGGCVARAQGWNSCGIGNTPRSALRRRTATPSATSTRTVRRSLPAASARPSTRAGTCRK